MFSEDFRKTNYIICKDENYIKYLGGKISEFKCDCGKEHIFEIDTDNYFKRKDRNCKLCTVCYPINEQVSIKEKELLSFVREIYKEKIIENYRDKYEIDVYLPDLSIGFEFNGLYWHSDKYINKDRHLDKLLYFKEKGIKIIYIWEDDWDFNTDIIKSQIKNWLGITENKIYGRKCEVREITDNNIIRDFLNKNHIQGFIHSTIKIGLFHEDSLVSVMTFDKMEGRKKMKENEWNLSRFCNSLNTNIIGGASKLLSYFMKNYKCERIISYADREWSDGKLYDKLGFELISESKISYKYFLNNNKKREHKRKYSKKNLIKGGFDKSKTEREIMIERGYNRVYDCGQLKFELKKED